MFKQLGIGLSGYGKAFGLIFSKGLWWTFLFPLIFNILLFWFGYQLIDALTEYLKTLVTTSLSLNNPDSVLGGFLKGAVAVSLWFILKILFFILFTYIGGFIVLIIMSPVLSYLSEKTEQIVKGKSYPFDMATFTNNIVRGILIALRNMIIQLALTIGIFLFTFIPVLGWIVGALSPFILFVVSSYFYGFSFMDYTNERRKMSVGKSSRLMWRNKWTVVGNGSIFSLSLMIPFCGTLVSPFVSIVSVVAGAISMEKIYEAQNTPVQTNPSV